ncbi:septal ring lytic transglycosylase RlpA family protein [Pantanalinema rosaneae CENA516]|uniref:septal ring lytic transglycosylase RlpA family protein n=1 Tax=Pantanalinema rosaneae TaxID=1620701 RepID=UPI003D6FDF7C
MPSHLFSFRPPPPSLATLTFEDRSSVDTVFDDSLSRDSDRFTAAHDWSFAPTSLSPWIAESSQFSFSRSAIAFQPQAVSPTNAELSWLDRLKDLLFRSQSRYTKLLGEVMKLAHSQPTKVKTKQPFTRATQELAIPTVSHPLNLFPGGFSGVKVISPPAEDAFTIVPIWGEAGATPEFPSVLEARFEDCPLVNPNATVVTSGSQRAFQIRFHDRVIAAAPEQWLAEQLVQELRQILDRVNLAADQVEPTTVEGMPAAELEIHQPADNRLLFTVDQEFAKAWGCDPELLAMDWVNNLRRAVNQPPLPFAVAQEKLYGLQNSNKKMTGIASWYGDDFHGLQTATGEIYDQHAFTAAHRSLPFDTYLKVKNLHNGRSVIVRINDRGPYIGNRTLDLSLAAARSLGSETIGLVPIEAIVMQSPPSSSTERLARANSPP